MLSDIKLFTMAAVTMRNGENSTVLETATPPQDRLYPPDPDPMPDLERLMTLRGVPNVKTVVVPQRLRWRGIVVQYH